MNSCEATVESSQNLPNVVAREGFARQALGVIERVAQAQDEPAVLDLLYQAKAALGADHAVFASFVRCDESWENVRFLLAAPPEWCLEYQRQGWYGSDPWLLYALTHSEPVCETEIELRTPSQRAARALAARHGMESALIVPAPSSGGLSRLGVLMLGSSRVGFFDSPSVSAIKILARSLAMDLHEWWVRRIRAEIIAENRLTPDDLMLLAYEKCGRTSGQIADAMGITPASVDSRFQRLNAKFNTARRAGAAKIASEYGLI